MRRVVGLLVLVATIGMGGQAYAQDGETKTKFYNFDDMLIDGALKTPDMFKDGAEVVVEGRLQYHETETVFLADNLLAKCPSKFEAQAAAGATPPPGMKL